MYMGYPLFYVPLPEKFRFVDSPEFKFRIGISLPNLPMHYWNAVGTSAIASHAGEPIEVDKRPILKENSAVPSAPVLIDAMKPPVESVAIKQHDGSKFEQVIEYDFFRTSVLFACEWGMPPPRVSFVVMQVSV